MILEQVYETIEETKQISQAAKDADRMGLEKKPGVGLYGKPNDPKASHKSRGGVLQPVLGDEPSTPKEKSPTANTPSAARISFPKPINPIQHTSRMFRRQYNMRSTRYHSSINVVPAALALQKALEHHAPEGYEEWINNVLSSVTNVYNRENAPSITGAGDALEHVEKMHSGKVLGVYDPAADAIEIDDIFSLAEIQGKPTNTWTQDNVNVMSVVVHEAIHSTSNRLTKLGFYTSGLNIAIEEGLTEYIARGIVTELDCSYWPRNCYVAEVEAIELMAHYGELDVNATFNNHTPLAGKALNNGTPAFEIHQKIYTAQIKAINNLFTKVKFSQEYAQEVYKQINYDFHNDVLSFANPQIRFALFYLEYLITQYKEQEIPPNLLDTVKGIFDVGFIESQEKIAKKKAASQDNVTVEQLINELLKKDVEERSIWKTYAGDFGARNTIGQVRYFDDRDAATAFARGTVPGPRLGRPKPKKRAERKEKIQKYDVTPVTKN